MHVPPDAVTGVLTDNIHPVAFHEFLDRRPDVANMISLPHLFYPDL
jgi:hypothetical protein